MGTLRILARTWEPNYWESHVKPFSHRNTFVVCWPALLAALVCYLNPAGAPGSERETAGPLTVAEKSDFQATSRSAEVVQFIDQLSGTLRTCKNSNSDGPPKAAHCIASSSLSPHSLSPPSVRRSTGG